jgi:phosphatidylserine decarboxylase
VTKNEEIQYFNRSKNKMEVEKVYGDAFIKLLYQSSAGKILSPIFANKYLSKAYGKLQSSMVTQLKVPKFVKNFNIDLSEYEGGSVKVENQELSYKNFNEFFIRKFRKGKRPFVQDSTILPACCEARYFGYDKIDENVLVPVKGKYLNATQLIGDADKAKDFEGGSLVIARLCPVDYHRYHYPDSGKTIESFPVHGQFHSVNPVALKHRPDIFIANERRVSILETKNFGKLAYIEVGAAMVGKIIQSHDEDKSFRRGQEKGYFLFGGSTVIVIGEQGRWTPSEDMVNNTRQGIETYLQLGEAMGQV